MALFEHDASPSTVKLGNAILLLALVAGAAALAGFFSTNAALPPGPPYQPPNR
jgi:hypothetical protein